MGGIYVRLFLRPFAKGQSTMRAAGAVRGGVSFGAVRTVRTVRRRYIS